MTAVWYDPDCDQIWISDRPEPFAPRTLALREADGLLHIHRRGQTVSIAAGPFDAFMDGAWQPFGSYDEAVTYLRDVFGRRPQAGDRYAIGISIAARGQTVIPLEATPTNFASLRLVVNGVTYRAPDIAVSPVAVTWASDAFPLDPADRVTVVYS